MLLAGFLLGLTTAGMLWLAVKATGRNREQGDRLTKI